MEQYVISFGQETVGKARVERQGLYYKVECVCGLPAGRRYHAFVQGDKEQEDLGLLVPVGGQFQTSRSVAVKKLGEGKLTFRIEPVVAESAFIPLISGKGVDCLENLRWAALNERDGVRGLIIQNH